MNQNLTLKQKGSNAVHIFPSPSLQRFVDAETIKDPTQFGYVKDENEFTFHRKIQSNNVVVGYQVLDGGILREAQVCQDYFNEALRSLNYDNCGIIENLGKLSLHFSKKN